MDHPTPPPISPKQRLRLRPTRKDGVCLEPWIVLVVDDDPEIHTMTRVLLRDFTFQDRRFEVLSAYSAAEARILIAQHPEVPVVLLDVVMESDDAGLLLARDIRDDLHNYRTRIVLRTGQPGEVPERDVMLMYDINDYRAKAELTAQKLFTTLVGALRSWIHIDTIERLNANLEQRVEERTRDLDAARRFAEQLVEMMPSPVWYRDADGCYRLYNRAFRDLFGIAGQSWIGLGPDEALGAPLAELAHASDARLMAGEETRVDFEAAVTGPDAQTRTVIVTKGRVAATEKDTAPGVIGVITDITERKALECELTRLARTDSLTGTANRRHFLDLAEREMERSDRYGRPLAVVMLDVDHFKQINDCHGHAFGDMVLQGVAAACRAVLRDVDCLGRLGGEEFAVLLPETALAGALDVAERLRLAIAQLPMPDTGKPAITASLGVAERLRGEGVFDHLLGRADAALYHAKTEGRNRVALAG